MSTRARICCHRVTTARAMAHQSREEEAVVERFGSIVECESFCWICRCLFHRLEYIQVVDVGAWVFRKQDSATRADRLHSAAASSSSSSSSSPLTNSFNLVSTPCCQSTAIVLSAFGDKNGSSPWSMLYGSGTLVCMQRVVVTIVVRLATVRKEAIVFAGVQEGRARAGWFLIRTPHDDKQRDLGDLQYTLVVYSTRSRVAILTRPLRLVPKSRPPARLAPRRSRRTRIVPCPSSRPRVQLCVIRNIQWSVHDHHSSSSSSS